MVANSEGIAGLINEASAKATMRGQPPVNDLELPPAPRSNARKKTRRAAVTEMMETHGMLRNDTSALFERLREANVLLQEVLGGATENSAKIETTLSRRVSEFVSTMNDIGEPERVDQRPFRASDEGVPDRAPARCSARLGNAAQSSRRRALACGRRRADRREQSPAPTR